MGSDSEAEPADVRVGELIPEGTTSVRRIALVIHGNQPFVIGRSACDFVIDDPRVSGAHVEICYDAGAVFIKDTSSNGTFINGSKIEPGRAVSLQEGDRLAFVQGDNPIKFVYKSAKARKSPTRRSANRSRNQSVSRPSSPSRNSLSSTRDVIRNSSRHRSPSNTGDRRSRSASVSRKARAKEGEDRPKMKEEKPKKEEKKKREDSGKGTKYEDPKREKRDDGGKSREEKEKREISPPRERKKERELRKSKLEDGGKKKKKSKKKDKTLGITPDEVLVSVTGESKMIKRGEGSGEESPLSEIEARDGSDTDPETEVSAALLLVGRFRKIVDVRDRAELAGLRKYPQSFIGKDAVTVMVDNGLASDRMHACRIANYLLQAGIFEQLGKKDNEEVIFKDAAVYYQFTKLQAAKKLGLLEPTKETKEANGDAMRVEVCSLEGQPFCFGNANIEDARISTKHFEIILDRKELFIRDTSKNGTQLNGKTLEHGIQTPLLDGAKIGVTVKDGVGAALTFVFRAEKITDVFLNSETHKTEEPVLMAKKKYTLKELLKFHGSFRDHAQVKDRSSYFSQSKQTFVGQEIIRDLVQKGIVDDRATAVEWGSELLRAGLIATKDDKALKFADDGTLYRFTNIPESEIVVEAPDEEKRMKKEKKEKTKEREKDREQEKGEPAMKHEGEMKGEMKGDMKGEMKEEKMRQEPKLAESKTKKGTSVLGDAKKKKKGAKNRRTLADDDKPMQKRTEGFSFNTPSGVVCTLAGDPEGGCRDGTVADCAFSHPGGVTVDCKGNIYISDSGNDRVRKIDANGQVCTLAGGGRDLTFVNPRGIVVDDCGNVIVADTDHHQIRKISPNGEVTLLAGSGEKGCLDGKCDVAMFAYPWGVAIDSKGNVIVSDSGNNRIRLISPSGMVSTLAGCMAGCVDGVSTSAAFNNPGGIAIDASGAIIVADRGNHCIRMISKDGAAVTTIAGSGEKGWFDGYRGAAMFNSPDDVAVDCHNNIYVADYQNDRIRRITPQGLVSTIAGNDVRGGSNGMGDQASFHSPVSLAVTPCGKVVVADSLNNQLRCIRMLRSVTILAGNGQKAFADGVGDTASFYGPAGLAMNCTGELMVADSWNQRIRKVLPLSGAVCTAAGNGLRGANDGACDAATFYDPAGVVVDSKGNVIISDSSNNRIRQLCPKGTVTTLAGGEPGCKDGNGRVAMFRNQGGLALHPNGSIIIADSGNHRIRQLSPDGEVTTIAGGERGYLDGPGAIAQFDTPDDVAVDSQGNIFVGDCNNFRVRVISPLGIVSTLAGSGTEGNADGLGDQASFGYPGGVTVDNNGNVLVADSSNDRICSISPEGEVTTIAGRWVDWQDGEGVEASFRHPVGMVVDCDGNIFVADYRGHIVYRIESEDVPQKKMKQAEFEKCLQTLQSEPASAVRRAIDALHSLRAFQSNEVNQKAKRLRAVRSRVHQFLEAKPAQEVKVPPRPVNTEALERVKSLTNAFVAAMETVQAFTDATAEVENVESRLATEFDETLSATLVQRNQLLKQVADLRNSLIEDPSARLRKVKAPKEELMALMQETQTDLPGDLVAEFSLLPCRTGLLAQLETLLGEFTASLVKENEQSARALAACGNPDPEDNMAAWSDATCVRQALTRNLLEAIEQVEKELCFATVAIKRYIYTLQTDIDREGRAFMEPSSEQRALEAEVRKFGKDLLFFQQFASASEVVNDIRQRYQQLSNRLFELEEEADNVSKRIQKRRQFAKLVDLRTIRDEVTALRLSRDYRQTTARLRYLTRFLPELSVEFPELSPFHGTAAQYLDFQSLDVDYRDVEELQTGDQHLMFLAAIRHFDDEDKKTQENKKYVLKQFEFIKDNSSGVARGVLRRKADLLARMQFEHIMPICAVVRQEVPEDHNAENWFIQVPFYARNLGQWAIARRDALIHEGIWKSVVARVFTGLAAGLGELHANGIFHRKLKPSNILMGDDDEAVLADFDLRQSLSAEDNRNRPELSKGSAGFMDPEVAFHGAPYSAASDMYALGVIMSEVLLGKRLTSPEDVDNVMKDASKLDGDQADLLRKLLAPLGKDRPCASQFMSHKCIQGVKRKLCILCRQSVLEIDGGTCERSKHFVCNVCFSDLVTHQAMESKRQLERRKGLVICSQKGCPSRPYSSSYLVLHADDAALEAHVQAYQTLLDEEPEVADKAVLAELKAWMAMNARDRRIAATAKHIKENILTLRCPVCFAPHTSFEGSYALSCERCPTDFCGFCSAVKGDDIYSHVAACPRSLYPGRVFGPKEVLDRAQTMLKQQQLERYFAHEVAQEDVPFINSLIATELTLLNKGPPVVTIRLRG